MKTEHNISKFMGITVMHLGKSMSYLLIKGKYLSLITQ